MAHKPAYEEAIARLIEFEKIFEALKNQEVDAIVGSKNVFLLRLKDVEENLIKQREDMEELLEKRNELLEDLKIHQTELEAQAQELRQAEEEIREARDKYHDLYEFAPLGYLTLAKDTRILEANLTAAQMLGCSKNELIKASLSGLAIDPQDTLYFHIKKVLETGQEQNCELLLNKRDGAGFHVLLTSRALNSGNKQRRIRTAMTDIGERKKVEAELRVKDYAIRSAVAGIAMAGLDKRLTYANPAMIEMWGYRAVEDVLGKPADRFVAKTSRAREAFESTKEKGEWQGELQGKKKDGSIFDVYVTANMVRDDQGKPILVMASFLDISERNKVEEALRRSENRFRALRDASSDELFSMNPDWSEMRRLNRRGLLSDKKSPIRNRLKDDIPPEDRPRVTAAVKEAIRTKGVFELEHLVRRDDGSMGWTLSRAVPMLNSDGEIVEWFGADSDITERKKTEQMKDEFLSLVSHELRTPLTVIGSSLKVALDERASPREVRDLIQGAAENTDILADILENMLELTRYQTGHLELMTEATDIGMLTGKIIDKLKSYGAKQTFEVSMPTDLPLLEVDPLRLERILHNLLENAVKFSPEESSISVIARQDGAFLVTGVTDQGTGISMEDRKNLFQMFNRLGNPAAVSGTGLGLMVCLRLLEAHGGWIKVDSAPGRGSTFSFGLPLPRAE